MPTDEQQQRVRRRVGLRPDRHGRTGGRRTAVGALLPLAVAAVILPAHLLPGIRSQRVPARVTGAAAESGGLQAPVLLLAADSDTGLPGDGVTAQSSPRIVVTAAGAAARYTVALFLDGAGAPVATRTVPAGVGAGFSVRLPALAHGRHRLRALAEAAGSRSGPADLEITVQTGPVEGSRLILGGDGDGRPGPGDTVTISFDRPLLADTVCATWADLPGRGDTLRGAVATLTPDPAAGTAVLTLRPPVGGCGYASTGLALGRVSVNGGYLSTPAPVRFGGSTLSLSPDRRTITLSLGRPDPAGAAGLGRVAVPSQPVFTPSGPAPTDLAGNAVDVVGFADPARSGF